MKITLTTTEANKIVAEHFADTLNLHATVEVQPEPAVGTQSRETVNVYQAIEAARETVRLNRQSGDGYWKIPAIKRVREITGMGLADAKHFVEAVCE